MTPPSRWQDSGGCQTKDIKKIFTTGDLKIPEGVSPNNLQQGFPLHSPVPSRCLLKKAECRQRAVTHFFDIVKIAKLGS
jgi:hypothetical protein